MERMIAQGVSLIVSIILARLLSPTDYGVVGLVMVFFQFANVIISGGLNTALIQKKNADDKDYSTVLSISLVVSIVVYSCLYFMAPIIAKIYDAEILIPIIRVLGISLPIYACKSIICAYISSTLQFRKFFFATLIGTVISAVVGIEMAIYGFGPWALTAQQLTNTFIDTLVLFISTKKRWKLKIYWERASALMKYGFRILLSSLISTVYTQINPLFIGTKFSSHDLSFYSKGKLFPETVSSSITNTLSSVLFPVLSKKQNDKEVLLRYTRLFIRVSSFIVFPALLGFFAVSDNFIMVLLTDKWLPASYYMRIFCVCFMFDVIAVGNCETIKASGRSDIFLKLEIIKKSLYFLIIGAFLVFSKTPEILAISMILCTVVQLCVNALPNIKLIGYSIKMQIIDILPNIFISVVMCVFVIMIGKIQLNGIIVLVVQVLSGLLVYLLLSIVTRNKSYIYLCGVVAERIRGKKRHSVKNNGNFD